MNASNGCLNGKDHLKLRFRTPKNVLLSAVLIDPKGMDKRAQALTQSENCEKVIYLNFRQKGDHMLNIFTREKTEESSVSQRQYSSPIAMVYSIKVSNFNPSLPTFPETTGTFNEEDVQLDHPKSRNLTANDFHTFRIRVPKAKDVSVNCGDQWQHLVQREGWFEGAAYIKEGPVKLMARFKREKHYWQLAEYKGTKR
jgi:hypothetical protein